MPVNPFDPTAAAALTAKSEPKKEVKPVPVHKKPKPMVQATLAASTGFPAPGDPYWKNNPLITEHADGSVRKWGEDTTATKNPNTLPKQMLPPPATKPPVGSGSQGHGDFGRYDTEGNRSTRTPDVIPSNNK